MAGEQLQRSFSSLEVALQALPQEVKRAIEQFPEIESLMRGSKEFFISTRITGEDEFNLVAQRPDRESYDVVLDPNPVQPYNNPNLNFYFITFLNSQAIPDELLKQLADNVGIQTMANRFPIDPAELLFYAGQESNQQTLTLAIGPQNQLGMVAGLILAEYQFNNYPIRFLYRNASAAHPKYPGLYSKHVEKSARRYPINIFGASTNEPSLPGKWRQLASEGLGDESKPWLVFPNVDNNGELIGYPPQLQEIIERLRSILGLNAISGTNPDFNLAGIRRSQEGGVIRPWNPSDYGEDPVYNALIEKYNFDPGNGDQILFTAISPTLANSLGINY